MVINLINYPSGVIKKSTTKVISFSNRGMSLEDDLNTTNTYYRDKNIAIVYKKPTPIKVVSKNGNEITKAFFKEPSTTDYNGIYKGKYIDFEAKETTSKTSFPLSNIHKHQVAHLKRVLEQNGICFLIVRFTTLNKTFILFCEDFFQYINNNDRKSIPICYFEEKGYLIKEKLAPRVDYIDIVNKYGGI